MDIQALKIIALSFMVCFVMLVLALTTGYLKVKIKYKNLDFEIDRKKDENTSSNHNHPIDK